MVPLRLMRAGTTCGPNTNLFADLYFINYLTKFCELQLQFQMKHYSVIIS
jgi:hypothetical protein